MIKYTTIPEFDKDFKSLLKRYRTLENDFEVFKKFSLETHFIQNIPTTNFIPIGNFCTESMISYKVRKFACKSLLGKGNRSGIRIIFVWHKNQNKITFVEIYYKGDKAEEDRKRLRDVLRMCQ